VTSPLQNVTLGGDGDRTPELYLRVLSGAPVSDAGALALAAGYAISSDTYFGAFPLAQWRDLCALSDLRLVLALDGGGTLQIKTLAVSSSEDMVLGEWLVAGDCEIALGHLLEEAIDAQGIYFVFTASQPSRLRSATYATRDLPRRRVDLGLVVTTFRRVDAVKATIHRLQAQIDADIETALGSLKLIVIDNGEELDPQGFPGTLVIPNPNMGGAGGFARGLLHLVDEGICSHACFMDDDASTEEECIQRTRRLLAFVLDENTAVSAAMLRSEQDHIVHEQGASFVWRRNTRIISSKHGCDVLKRKDLVEVLRPEPVGYGGWWYFAFPIRRPLKFPYPMFVRGDDWLFSYLNGFTIRTPLGIASWQEGFAGKLSPVEQYLAFKAFLVMELIVREQSSFAASKPFFQRWIQSNLDGYCYDRAAMNLEAMKDVLSGPEFWADNVLLGNRLAALKPLITAEFYKEPGPREAPAPRGRYNRGLKRRFRRLTLNGHLLPRRILRDRVAVDKNFAPSPEAGFLYGTIDYVDNASGKSFSATRDTRRYFQTRTTSRKLAEKIEASFSDLRGRYLSSVDRFCTPEWWRQQFEKHGPQSRA
jgi:hypothetical protein